MMLPLPLAITFRRHYAIRFAAAIDTPPFASFLPERRRAMPLMPPFHAIITFAEDIIHLAPSEAR
jgi:hypothetical protein